MKRKRRKKNCSSYYNEKISDYARVSEFCVTKIKYSDASELLKILNWKLNEDYLHLLSLRKGKKERKNIRGTIPILYIYLSVIRGTIPLLYI